MSCRYGVFCGLEVPLPVQVVYQTNADWHATYEALANNCLIKADTTEKGLIQFWFKDNPTLFMLSPNGKLQVKWSNLEEKKTLFKLVENLLVAVGNEKLIINPLKQQLWIEYPVPDSFKVYWCDQSSEYALKNQSKSKNDESVRKFSLVLQRIWCALEELRHEFRFLREPSFNEVVLRAQCFDKSRVDMALTLKGWRESTLDRCKYVAEKTLTLAAWLRYEDSGEDNHKLLALSKECINATSIESIQKAQFMLKTYPELIPQVGSNMLIWPEETKTKWVEVFNEEPPAPQTWN